MQQSSNRLASVLSTLFVVVSTVSMPRPAPAATTQLITRDPATGAAVGGTLGARRGQGTSVSADGRIITTRRELGGQPGLAPIVDGTWYDRLSGASGAIGSSAQLSFQPHISADGRFIAFDTYLNTLTIPFAGGWVLDRKLGTTTLIAGGGVSPPALEMSAEGRYLTFGFLSLADRLAPGTGAVDIALGLEPALAADGRAVAFTSSTVGLVPDVTDANGGNDVFLWDRATHAITLVSRAAGLPATANNASSLPEISADGQVVIFRSQADNLVSGQSVSNDIQLFAFDRATGQNVLVSHSFTSPAAPINAPVLDAALSANGRFVAFVTQASDVLAGLTGGNGFSQLYVYDRLSGITTLESHTDASPTERDIGYVGLPTISADGRYLASTGGGGVHFYDRGTGTNLVIASGGFTSPTFGDFRPEISADGTTVVFDNLMDPPFGTGSVDVYAWRRDTHPGAFFTVPPCRLLDTRVAGQGPGLTAGALASWPVHARCGIPSTARAVSLNLTVVPSHDGYVALFPGDLATPPPISTINFRGGQVKANNAVVSLAGDGSGTLAAQAAVGGGGTVHVILDVNGYFE